MSNTQVHEDLPLTDPKHPLHVPVSEPSRPVAKELKSDRKVQDTNATMKAEATKRKAVKESPKLAAAIEAADEAGVKLPRSVVPPKFKKLYQATDNTCGDALAFTLKKYTTGLNEDGRETMDISKLREVADVNGVEVVGKNPGLMRMNVSNRLRGLVKHGKTVIIGKSKFANAERALHKEPIAA